MSNTVTRKVYQIVPSGDMSLCDRKQGKTEEGYCLCKRIRLCIEDYSIQECAELAFLQGYDFQKIFGERNPEYGSNLAVVKIRNPKTKKSIHRLYRTSTSIHKMDNYVALSYNSLLALSIDTESLNGMDELEISVGSRMSYYWNHPYSMTKVAWRLGIISFIISILSLIGTIISLSL